MISLEVTYLTKSSKWQCNGITYSHGQWWQGRRRGW